MNSLILKLSLLLYLFILYCSPLPGIQSSKIRGDFSLGGGIGASNNEVINGKDSALFAYDLDRITFGPGVNIFNRIELSGFIVPFIPCLWDANVKISAFDIGNHRYPLLNLSSSVIMKSTFYFNLAGGIGPFFTSGGGLVVGTTFMIFGNELEIVFMPMFNYRKFSEYSGEGDTTANVRIIRYTKDFGFGILYYRGILKNRLKIEMNVGAYYSDIYKDYSSGEYFNDTRFNRLTYKTGFRIYFLKKPQLKYY